MKDTVLSGTARNILGGGQTKMENPLMNTDDRDIIQTIGMAELPRIIDTLYTKYHGRYQLIDIGGDCMFRFGNTNVANVSYLATYIHFIKIENDVLKIEGNVSWPAVLKEYFRLHIRVNGVEYAPRMFEAGFDLADGTKPYETRTAFSYEQTLDHRERYEVAFIYECNGITCKSGKINAMRFSPVADVLDHQYALRDGWLLWIEDGQIRLQRAEGEQTVFEQRFRDVVTARLDGPHALKVLGIREAYFVQKAKQKKKIWLFMDRIDKADDNGEAFFTYVCQRKPENIDCYFVIDKDSADHERLQKIGNVVDALSKEHCVLLLLAEYIFTSQLNGWAENPYGPLEEWFRDLYHEAKVIFLQHGVTKDDQTKWLNRYNQNLYAIVCSSPMEKSAFLTYPYFYKEKQIWNVGMPRLEKLENNTSRTILFMPTWRRRLMEQKEDSQKGIYRWHLREGFWQSVYYRMYHEVLNDKAFLNRCQDAGYRVLFMPHPIMQPYILEFQVSDEVITLPYETSIREIFEKSSMMITDYSSVAFDFAYLHKPVIYWQFDREEFFASHTYREGYFDYQTMGFGEVVTTKQTLYQTIDTYLESGCREKDVYEKRVNDFFTYTDAKCCERIYEKVMRNDNGI
mgnify:CR=1 FL=1